MHGNGLSIILTIYYKEAGCILCPASIHAIYNHNMVTLLQDKCCQIQQCSLTQYTGFTCLQELGKCHFNISDRDTYTLPSACMYSDQNETTPESVALQVFQDLKLFNASQECVEGFRPWICRQLIPLCDNISTGKECEEFESLCADNASLLMTSSLLRSVCFFTATAISIGKIM